MDAFQVFPSLVFGNVSIEKINSMLRKYLIFFSNASNKTYELLKTFQFWAVAPLSCIFFIKSFINVTYILILNWIILVFLLAHWCFNVP